MEYKFKENSNEFEVNIFMNSTEQKVVYNESFDKEINFLVSKIIDSIKQESNILKDNFEALIKLLENANVNFNFHKEWKLKKYFKNLLISCPYETLCLLCLECTIMICKNNKDATCYFGTQSFCFAVIDFFDRYGTNALCLACDILSNLMFGFDNAIFEKFNLITYTLNLDKLNIEEMSKLGDFYLSVCKYLPSEFLENLCFYLLILIEKGLFTTPIQTLSYLSEKNFRSKNKELVFEIFAVRRKFVDPYDEKVEFKNSLLEKVIYILPKIPSNYLFYGLHFINLSFKIKLDYYQYLGGMIDLEYLNFLYRNCEDAPEILYNSSEILCSLLGNKYTAEKILQTDLIFIFYSYLQNASFNLRESSLLAICKSIQFMSPKQIETFILNYDLMDKLICFLDNENIEISKTILHSIWIILKLDNKNVNEVLLRYSEDIENLHYLKNESIDSYIYLINLQLFKSDSDIY